MKERFYYIDVLKIFALFAVISIHLASPMWWNNSVYNQNFVWANLFEGISRWAVPVFIMCAGAFILNPKSELPTKKLMNKMFQMILALFIFGTLYSITFELIAGAKISFSLLTNALYNIYQVDAANHLWFIYMLLGLYLVTPILKSYIKGATKENIEYFLLLWAIFGLTFPVLTQLVKSLNPIIDEMRISLVLYYPGYYILGYYLKTYDLNKLTRNIIYLGGIIGLFITVVMTYNRSIEFGHISQTFFRYTSLNVAFVGTALFVFAKNFIDVSEKWQKPISTLSKYTFGIFLVHGIFVYITPKIVDFSFLHEHLYLIPVFVPIIYFTTFIIVYLLCKIPGLNKILT